MKKKGGILWYILIGILVVALAVIVAVALSKDKTPSGEGNTPIVDDSNDHSNEIGGGIDHGNDEAPPKAETGNDVFVMFGVDSRSGGLGRGTRSDSIMLIRLDHDAKQVKVVSIYRETLVYQEGRGYKLLNAAHSYGGPEFALSVINENFDFNIEHYCSVDFDAVGDLVDMVGGVEIELTEDEIQHINGYITETNSVRGTNSPHITEPGVHLLDGTQAVSFSRIRYTVGYDYKRTERQREVLFKIFEQSKQMTTDERLEVVETLIGEVNTNYSEDEMLVLMYYLSEYEIAKMTAYPQVFFAGSIPEASSVQIPYTLIEMNAELHKILLGEEDYEPSDKVQQYNDELCDKVSGPNKDMREEKDGE